MRQILWNTVSTLYSKVNENMAKTVIGFMGLAGAGKTTTARILQAKARRNSSILPFAAPLKEAVQGLFLFSDEQLYTAAKDEIDPRWGFTPRRALQVIGTDAIRDRLNHNFWVMRMEEVIRESTSEVILIDDVRFENEADLITSFRGVNIHVAAPDECLGDSSDCHASERVPCHKADFTFINVKEAGIYNLIDTVRVHVIPFIESRELKL